MERHIPIYCLLTVTVAPAQPTIFTKEGSGRGQGLIYAVSSRGTQTLAEPATPAKAGDSIVIECTGLGAVDQPTPADSAAPESPIVKAVGPVSASIGGAPATVASAGPAPGDAVAVVV